MTELFIMVGAIYLLLVLASIVRCYEYRDVWTVTPSDYLWDLPADIALGAFGWLVMNAALVAAALVVVGPVLFIVWLVLL